MLCILQERKLLADDRSAAMLGIEYEISSGWGGALFALKSAVVSMKRQSRTGYLTCFFSKVVIPSVTNCLAKGISLKGIFGSRVKIGRRTSKCAVFVDSYCLGYMFSPFTHHWLVVIQVCHFTNKALAKH